MFKAQLITIAIIFKNLFCPCHKDKKISHFQLVKREYSIQKVGKLPKEINESSGLIRSNSNSYLTHNDGGPSVKLFEINKEGKILSDTLFSGIATIDLEEITRDDRGNIYLGDFGNNANIRRDLKILKLNSQVNRIDTISFLYPDQRTFPPIKEARNFDCEAFFWFRDSLYLFSKNRGNNFVKFYKLPDVSGTYTAEEFKEVYINSMITGAALSPDKKEFVLLSYGKIYFFRIMDTAHLTFDPYFCLRFARSGQAEGIVYLNEKDLLVSNEGGELFLVKKRASKP